MRTEASDRDARWRVALLVTLVVLAAAAVIAHVGWNVPLARRDLGLSVSDVGLVVQLVAMLLGVIALSALPAQLAPTVLVIEGAICVLAFDLAGVAFLLALVGFWACVGTGGQRWLRLVLAVALLVALNACAWTRLSPVALLFSATFSMRLIMFAYERWQHDFEPVPLRAFLVYMLPAPLIFVPPFLLIIPRFGDFESRVRPELTRARVIAIAGHVALAAVFGGARLGVAELGIDAEVLRPSMYVGFAASLLEFAALAHLFIALLLVHGIEERAPIDQPLRATTFVELWHRMNVHLKDAQVFLFYTPAILRLRRMNRYVAIVLATFWTMVVGNTLLHVVVRYCFVVNAWERIAWALVANTLMAVALSVQLCFDERRASELGPRTTGDKAIGWAVTMSLVATVATI